MRVGWGTADVRRDSGSAARGRPRFPLRSLAQIAGGLALALSASIPASAASAATPAVSAEATPAACRATPVGADAPLRSAEARATFGVDGTGVRVGIISGSFDTGGVETTAAEDVHLGALPGPGNPCGREQPVEVLIESTRTDNDEGRAMAQVVHGIAPGADLLFAAAGGQPDDSGFVEAIRTLVAAGADVIVDDIGANAALAYQPDAVAQAVREAVEAGVLYLAASANYGIVGAAGYPSAGYPIGGWSTEAYRPTGCPAEVAAFVGEPVDCLDVDPGTGEDPTNGIVLDAGGLMFPRLDWAEPAGFATTAFRLLITDASGAVVRSATPEPGVPYASTGLINPEPVPASYSVVVARRLDAATGGAPAVRWSVQNPGPMPTILDLEHFRTTGPDAAGSTLAGHQADPATLAVGAVHSGTRRVESFSSIGPATRWFGASTAGAPAPPLEQPVTVVGPAVAGVDRLSLTFSLTGSGSGVFSGTSAAAPTVAAVAALGLQAAPDLGPAELRAAIEATADPAGFETIYPADVDPARVTGHGLVDAYALVASLAVPPSPEPIPAPSPGPVPEPEPGPVAAAPPAAAAAGSRPDRLAESGTTVVPATVLAALLASGGFALLTRARRRRRSRTDG